MGTVNIRNQGFERWEYYKLYAHGSEKPNFNQKLANIISYIAILKLKLSKTHDFNVFSIQSCSEVKRKGWRAVLEAPVFLSKVYTTLLLFHIVNILYTASKRFFSNCSMDQIPALVRTSCAFTPRVALVTQFGSPLCTDNVFPFISLFEKFIITALNLQFCSTSSPLEFEKQSAIALMHAVQSSLIPFKLLISWIHKVNS